MTLRLVLSQTDKRPMYQQIMEQIVQRIAIGDLPPETQLPSIRELAIVTKVSIITVKRAYMELEREGVIVTQQGKGSWVSLSMDLQRLQREELAQYLEQVGRLARALEIPEDEILDMVRSHLR